MFHKRNVSPRVKALKCPPYRVHFTSALMLSLVLSLMISLVFSLLLLFLVPAQVSFAQEPIAATDSNAVMPEPPGERPEPEASSSDAEPEEPEEPEDLEEPDDPLQLEKLVQPEEPVQPADMVSTFSELTEWIDDHKKSGGTVRLENHIFLQAGERYIGKNSWPGDPTLYIDVGEYTIYVSGHLELYPELNFSGVGGENGIFHVEPGGYLQLNSFTGEGYYESYVTVSAAKWS